MKTRNADRRAIRAARNLKRYGAASWRQLPRIARGEPTAHKGARA